MNLTSASLSHVYLGDTGFVSPDLSPKCFGTGWDALEPKFRQKSVIPDDLGTPWPEAFGEIEFVVVGVVHPKRGLAL